MKNIKLSKSLITKIISAVVVIVISVFGGKEILSEKNDTTSSSSTSYSQSLQVSSISDDDYSETSYDKKESNHENKPETSSSGATSSSSLNAVELSSEQSYESEKEEIQYYFASQHLLDTHFDKHKHEFDGLYATAEEYEEGANKVINSPDALYKTEKDDGDHIYYIEKTNEFVVVSTNGSIRTYFKPTDGIRYFNRQ